VAAQGALKQKGGKFATIVGDSATPGVGMLGGIVNRKFWSMFGSAPDYRIFLTHSNRSVLLAVAVPGRPL
jgi:hypothetical protein